MIRLDVYNQKAEKSGEVEVSEKVFGISVNEDLLHQAVVTQISNERQVLAHTKGRGDVRGGGKKPWRQKGTGRARAGSSRSPIWIGGGVTFGPTKDRNFSKKINKKMKQKALLMALSDKIKHKGVVVLDDLKTDEFKTKIFDEIFKKIEKNILKIENRKTKDSEDSKSKIEKKNKYKRSFLVMIDEKDEKIKFSIRNLSGVKFINLNNINIVDLLKFKNLILTKAVLEAVEKAYK